MNNDNHNHNRNNPRRRFAHERLDVYHVVLRLFRDVYRLAEGLPTGHSGLAQQMRRAASSIMLNIAEGANRMSHKDKASRFVIARGECGETACALDLVLVLELVPRDPIDALKANAGRVAAMLTGLANRERRLSDGA